MESQAHFQAELELIDHWLAGYQSKRTCPELEGPVFDSCFSQAFAGLP